MCKEQNGTMPFFLPYFWDLVADAAQQEWDKFVEIRVSVSHMEKPTTNNSSDSFSHLQAKESRTNHDLFTNQEMLFDKSTME